MMVKSKGIQIKIHGNLMVNSPLIRPYLLGGGTREEYVLCDELLLGTIVWHVFF